MISSPHYHITHRSLFTCLHFIISHSLSWTHTPCLGDDPTARCSTFTQYTIVCFRYPCGFSSLLLVLCGFHWVSRLIVSMMIEWCHQWSEIVSKYNLNFTWSPMRQSLKLCVFDVNVGWTQRRQRKRYLVCRPIIYKLYSCLARLFPTIEYNLCVQCCIKAQHNESTPFYLINIINERKEML